MALGGVIVWCWVGVLAALLEAECAKVGHGREQIVRMPCGHVRTLAGAIAPEGGRRAGLGAIGRFDVV